MLLGYQPHSWWWVADRLFLVLFGGEIHWGHVCLTAHSGYLILFGLHIGVQVHIILLRRWLIVLLFVNLGLLSFYGGGRAEFVYSLSIGLPNLSWAGRCRNDLASGFWLATGRWGAEGNSLDHGVIPIPICTCSHLLQTPLDVDLMHKVVLLLLSVRSQIPTTAIVKECYRLLIRIYRWLPADFDHRFSHLAHGLHILHQVPLEWRGETLLRGRHVEYLRLLSRAQSLAQRLLFGKVRAEGLIIRWLEPRSWFDYVLFETEGIEAVFLIRTRLWEVLGPALIEVSDAWDCVWLFDRALLADWLEAPKGQVKRLHNRWLYLLIHLIYVPVFK